MKIALLFPGQGSQSVGMGKSLYDTFEYTRPIFDVADQMLGFSLTKLMFEGTDEDLKQTEVTQPAIFTVSCAAFEVFKKECTNLSSQVAFAAGHSLGEYSAFYAAGAFDFATGISLVKARGQAIQKACAQTAGTMAAILGVERAQLIDLCAQVTQGSEFCECVNFNCAGQIVVAGSVCAVQTLSAKLAEVAGSKVIPLSVSGAFHSRAMQPAAAEMGNVLFSAKVQNSAIPVYTNVDGKATQDAELIKQKLQLQIDHPVLWEDSIAQMMVAGADNFIELGAGRVLSGLMRKIDRKIPVSNIQDAESAEKLKQTTTLTI